MTRTKKRLPRILTLSTAKRNYGQILDRVHRGKERFVVHSRGYAEAAVIVSVGEYLSAFAEAPSQFKTLRREANALGLKHWTAGDLREEIDAFRFARRRELERLNG